MFNLLFLPFLQFKTYNVASGQTVKNGLYATYYPNGDVYILESYKNNQLHGPVIGFYENKRVNISGYYLNGKKHGNWSFFNEKGTLRKIVTFQNDKEVKTILPK